MSDLKKKFLICRTDSIGDVVLTLPLAGYLKEKFPEAHIGFLCRNYTAPVVRFSEYVDEVLVWDEQPDVSHFDTAIAVYPDKELLRALHKQGVPTRIATGGRIHSWQHANKRVKFSRRKSDLHEAQLNFKLLQPLGIDYIPALKDIPEWYGMNVTPYDRDGLIDPERFNLILHPKSQGSAREWGVDNFEQLLKVLPHDNYRIYISGTQKEGDQLQEFLAANKDRVVDITGKFSLKEFIGFIAACDGLVAASTGPLHIAAALGKHALGIFAPMKPIHPGRWAPLGKNAKTFVLDKECDDCRKTEDCYCITSIAPQELGNHLTQNIR